ncbi:unnamed protein product [Lactuca saligna]|uniref:Uncharacterized protein n=1 Tax=Lactuca saligna TaxID=75948 RepID=A0AA35ZXQ8_LACSI|nr:unnamed protein product [Lactuca saligna]
MCLHCFHHHSTDTRGYKRFYRRQLLETLDYLKDDCLKINCTVGMVVSATDCPRRCYTSFYRDELTDKLVASSSSREQTVFNTVVAKLLAAVDRYDLTRLKRICESRLYKDLLNVFEVFLPQLLLYPNPSDLLNGDAESLMIKDKEQYEKKVKEYCELYEKKENINGNTLGDESDENESNEDISDGKSESSEEDVAGNADP